MVQNKIKRPRVAAIGLNKSQIEAITPLCGILRSYDTLSDYTSYYSWNETDVIIFGSHPSVVNVAPVYGHVLIIGTTSTIWSGYYRSNTADTIWLIMEASNTERETRITDFGRQVFGHLASELSGQLDKAERPPTVCRMDQIQASKPKIGQSLQYGIKKKTKFAPERILHANASPLIETTSGLPVAMLCDYPHSPESSKGAQAKALVLPREAHLSKWLQAFLTILHEHDPKRVPNAPPRLSNPADWYTPEERKLASQLTEIADDIKRLEIEQERVQIDLDAAGEEANAGIRRCLWADGDELVNVISRILHKIGFAVRDMDAEKELGEPKREDLRLTLKNRDGWEAIAEVKGYTKGVRTTDARQIREHREFYITANNTLPDLTLWISNPHRNEEPEIRPALDIAVREHAENIGAVHVLATDLYRLWALVTTGSLSQEQAIQQLVDASPGLWSLRASDVNART